MGDLRQRAADEAGRAAAVVAQLAGDGALLDLLVAAAETIAEATRAGGRVIVFGNGGSAADAQHLAAELVGRFRSDDRPPLAAEALTTNASIITAIANDFGYDEIFARQIDAGAAAGDVVLGITTSGRSENVVRGLRAAREKGCATIVLTGSSGRGLASDVDFCLVAPGEDTARVQESHIVMAHILCELVETIAAERQGAQ
jgi:D-sedoheptulose 7-phosphate isomerase